MLSGPVQMVSLTSVGSNVLDIGSTKAHINQAHHWLQIRLRTNEQHSLLERDD